ncbi:hypothetical protein PI124_g2492 [Phytophthora idaei]|nr:hypothetical protein PI124_g2492 [Phytophthora idaei]
MLETGFREDDRGSERQWSRQTRSFAATRKFVELTTATNTPIGATASTLSIGEREEELCAQFLNTQLASSGHAQPKRRIGDIGSLWVDVQRHLRALGLQHGTAPAQAATRTPALALQLRVPHHDKWLTHRDVLRHVKLHLKQRHWLRWAAMKDQGKAYQTTLRSHCAV